MIRFLFPLLFHKRNESETDLCHFNNESTLIYRYDLHEIVLGKTAKFPNIRGNAENKRISTDPQLPPDPEMTHLATKTIKLLCIQDDIAACRTLVYIRIFIMAAAFDQLDRYIFFDIIRVTIITSDV